MADRELMPTLCPTSLPSTPTEFLSPQTTMMMELHWQHFNTRAFLNAYGVDNFKKSTHSKKSRSMLFLVLSPVYILGPGRPKHTEATEGQSTCKQENPLVQRQGTQKGCLSTESSGSKPVACQGVQPRKEGKVSEYVHRRLVRIQAELAKPGLKSHLRLRGKVRPRGQEVAYRGV